MRRRVAEGVEVLVREGLRDWEKEGLGLEVPETVVKEGERERV